MFIQAAPLPAQRLGDGRFLRRMLGVEPPVSAQQSEAERLEASRSRKESASRKDAQAAQATPGQPATARPSTSQSTRRIPNAPAPRRAYPPTRAQRSPGPPADQLPATRADRAQAGFQQFQQPKPVRTLKDKGFGITFRASGNQVIVANVDPAGTAAKAGIQSGDIVKSIASLPISNPADVKQFTEVLKPGDQVEFEVMRRGKEGKVLVSYIREAHSDSVADSARRQDDETSLRPTPAKSFARSTSQVPKRFSSGQRSEVEELREVVRRQKQVIAELQKHLRALEQSGHETGPTLAFPR